MKKQYKFSIIVLSVAICFVMLYKLSLTAFAAGNIIDSGTCGENLTWELDDNYELSISGFGAMSNYREANSVPWYDYRKSIETIVVNNGVTTIGDHAFYYLDKVSSITLPNTLSTIGNYAFSLCNMESLTLPNSLLVIGDSAFWGNNFKSISLPNSITHIGNTSFSGCNKLTTITLPASLQFIGSSAFNNCEMLSSVTINGNIADLTATSEVFRNAGKRADSLIITFGSGVTHIPAYLFHTTAPAEESIPSDYYAHISKVIIPASVTSIRSFAFGYCYDLASVEFLGNAPTIQGGAFQAVSATATYRGEDSTWESIVNQGYGGNITWVGKYKPQITTQPANAKVATGKSATFTVTAHGENMSYQWYVQKKGSTAWTKVSGGKSAKLTVIAAADMDANKYRCEVTNDGGKATSSTATLTVLTKPIITTQPKKASVKAGKKVTFKVKANGGDLTYQWYYQKPGTNKWVKMSGKTKATLSFTAKKNKNGYKYKCLVKNAAGKTYTKAIKLTVK